MSKYYIPQVISSLLALASFASAHQTPTSEAWSKLTSQHFELFTDDKPEKVTNILKHLETTRSLYQAVSLSKQDSEFPVRVLVFRTAREFKKYTFESFAVGFYVGGMNRDYIVMENEDLDADREEVIDHEYAHYLLYQQKAKSATWLDEGMADLFSTVKDTANGVALGIPVESRVLSLRGQKLLPLLSLIRSDRRTLSANPENVDLFYAESWAFTHMLRFSPAYAAHFPELLKMIAAGTTTEQALTQVYGKTVDAVDADLHTYVKLNRYPTQLFGHEQAGKELAASLNLKPTAQLNGAESNAVLADLLGKLGRFAEAFNLLQPAMNDGAANAIVAETAAYLFVEQRKYSESASYFSQAAAKGSDNARLYYDYVRVLMSLSPSHQNLVGYLRKALELKPDFEPARKQLKNIGAAEGDE